MTSLPPVARWWADVAQATYAGSPAPVQGPPWLAALARAHQEEIDARPAEAERELAAVEEAIPPGPWRRVHALLRLRTEVRRGDAASVAAVEPRLADLLRATPAEEAATLARAWHLAGVMHLRVNRLEEAEAALMEALARVEDGAARWWILDGIAQWMIGVGEWEEARRTLGALVAKRLAAGDSLGVAISTGHLAQMDLGLARPREAADALTAALEGVGGRIPALSRLRLLTYLVQARLDLGDRAAVAKDAATLEALRAACEAPRHPLRAFAALALARAGAMAGDEAAASRWLSEARADATLPELAALVGYWEARLVPRTADDPAWLAGMQAHFSAARRPTEAEILTHVFLAERALERNDRAATRASLDGAFDLAARANVPAWLDVVDRAYRRLDPQGAAERLLERFSGRRLADLQVTRLEEASVVFADLVGFTPRSNELAPEEVMATVRSFFQMSVSLLADHRMRPLSYLGDGLLAVAQGGGHQERALSFAWSLVRRGERASTVRRALADRWGLALRAGVAAGPIVFGPLGSHMKTEYAAIGRTTNLAARLQGQAEPGQVVASFAGPGPPFARGDPERLTLKGFPAPVDAWRFCAAG